MCNQLTGYVCLADEVVSSFDLVIHHFFLLLTREEFGLIFLPFRLGTDISAFEISGHERDQK